MSAIPLADEIRSILADHAPLDAATAIDELFRKAGGVRHHRVDRLSGVGWPVLRFTVTVDAPAQPDPIWGSSLRARFAIVFRSYAAGCARPIPSTVAYPSWPLVFEGDGPGVIERVALAVEASCALAWCPDEVPPIHLGGELGDLLRHVWQLRWNSPPTEIAWCLDRLEEELSGARTLDRWHGGVPLIVELAVAAARCRMALVAAATHGLRSHHRV